MNIQDRIKGVFFGQAIGDALGLATEFMSKQEVKEHYPNGVHSYKDIVQDKHRSRWKAGDWTDDTQQWLCILDSYLTNNQLSSKDVARRFYDWMQQDGMGIGNTTYKVLNLPGYTEQPFKASELVWKIGGRKLAPNGALMRNSIVALINHTALEDVLQNCETISRLTHFDQRCVDSCKIMAHLIHGELSGSPIRYEALGPLLAQYDPRISDYILPLVSDIDLLYLAEPKTLGYTLKALAAGIWAYYFAASFDKGVKTIILEGGDADTNACIAGSLLGAKFGYESIDNELAEGLLQFDQLDVKYRKFIAITKY